MVGLFSAEHGDSRKETRPSTIAPLTLSSLSSILLIASGSKRPTLMHEASEEREREVAGDAAAYADRASLKNLTAQLDVCQAGGDRPRNDCQKCVWLAE